MPRSLTPFAYMEYHSVRFVLVQRELDFPDVLVNILCQGDFPISTEAKQKERLLLVPPLLTTFLF